MSSGGQDKKRVGWRSLVIAKELRGIGSEVNHTHTIGVQSKFIMGFQVARSVRRRTLEAEVLDSNPVLGIRRLCRIQPKLVLFEESHAERDHAAERVVNTNSS